MHSGQVNASQLLASFLASENEKIGQSIVQSDFAGELKKLMPAQANDERASVKNAQPKLQKAKAADSGLQASSAETPAAPETKSCPPSRIREQTGGTDSRTKINAIKSKAQKEQCLFVTNPAIAQTVLADLRYPAETKKACKDIQNEKGQISIKDLKFLLDTQPAIGPEIRAQVPAEHARALVESIIARKGGTNHKELTSGGSFKSSVQIKTEGSYSPDEFRGLLEKVLQEADTERTQFGNPGSQPGSAETAKTAKGPKSGQTERLAATVLPSFIFADHENDSTGKIFAANSNNPKLEAPSAKATDVRENSTEAVSDNLTPDKRLSAARIGSEAKDRQEAVTYVQAGTKGAKSETSPGSASAPPAARQQTASIPVEALDPILKYFDASIVSLVPQQPVVKLAETPAPGGPHDGLAAQAQNLAPHVKEAEKQADGPRGASSAWRLPEDIAQQSEAARIKTVPAEYTSNEWSSESTPNQTADSAQKTQAQPLPAEFDPEELRAQLRETSPGIETDGSEKTPKAVQSESQPGKLSDSIEGFKNRADFPPAVSSANPVRDNQDGAPAAPIDTVEIPVQLRETSRGIEITGKAVSAVVSEIPVEADRKTTGQSGSPPAVSKFDYSIDNLNSRADLSAFGQGSDSGPSLQQSASATTGTDPLEVVASHPELCGQDAVTLVKQVDKQLGSRDSAPEIAAFQNSVSSLHGNEINLPRMDNSAPNGFAYYDPYRSAELVQDMRERLEGAPASQLVLDMEPDGLGKINIKVEARKDEISVVALTQSEPARQALMRHSTELRQDLRDQGLALEKFMVDVNRDKSGGGNYPEANKAGGKVAPHSKAAKVPGVQPVDTPLFITKTAGRSQISIFA